MNKHERVLKGSYKFKKRLKQLNISDETLKEGWGRTKRGVRVNFNSYRTTGTPCSCAFCSPGKVEDKAKYRFNRFNKRNPENE